MQNNSKEFCYLEFYLTTVFSSSYRLSAMDSLKGSLIVSIKI